MYEFCTLGETELQIAIQKNGAGPEKIKSIIREHPGIVNVVDKCGYTALHDACANGDPEVVQVGLVIKNQQEPHKYGSNWGNCTHSFCKL